MMDKQDKGFVEKVANQAVGVNLLLIGAILSSVERGGLGLFLILLGFANVLLHEIIKK